MKILLTMLVVAAVALPAAAIDLGNRAPVKPAHPVMPPPPDPQVLRQGGDTLADAVMIPIPTIDQTGTTTGYNDDYDEVCPYTGGISPDVVYSIVPEYDMELDVDLCESLYDTKVFVYDENLALIACNDDFYGGPPCGAYRSKIEEMPVTAGVLYYVVVDGYTGDHGDYVLDVVEHVPCVLECPPGAALEEEPPLAIDYVDLHNGGCNTDQGSPPFQPITAPVFCGVSGFYLYQGSSYRDTDWFHIDIPASGVLEITGDAEEASYMFELGPQDCDGVGVLQNVVIGECLEGAMTITGEPGATVWFWVGPTTFSSPDGSDVYEYDYTLWLTVDVIAVEEHSWTAVKALFD